MKSQISSVDLHYLIEEMQKLVGSRVDKIYNPEKEEIVIQWHVAGKGREIIRIISGKFIFLSDYKGIYDEPSGFCMFLRKYLEGGKLKKIIQEGSERVALLVFERKGITTKMFVELFGKGNIVLTDQNDEIISALEQQKWADRSIMKGENYIFPKKEFDFFNITEKEFKKILTPDSELVYKLAKDIGMGGTYAEEVITLAGLNKNKKDISDSELKTIFKNFKKIIESKIQAQIIYENNKIKDIIPFELKIYQELDKKSFSSFNEAFDYFFKEEFTSKEEFKSKHQKEIDKVKNIIEQQNKQIDGLNKKAEEETKRAELIYERYQLVDEILQEIKKAREKYSFDEIREKLKGHKIIKEVNSKEKKIIVKF